MKIDPNNPRSFYLSTEKNQRVFKEEILPRIHKRFDFVSNKNPTVYLTAGLPGAGKSSIVENMLEESKNNKTFIANSDEMRPYHPKFKEAIEMFGSNAGAAVHKDATIFSEKLIKYAQEKRSDFIIDSTLRDPKKAEELITSLQDNKYNVKVTMLAVNEYESLHGVYNRYAKQYEANPATARFVDPKFIMAGKPAIVESAKMLDRKNIDEFKIVDRDHKLLYNSKTDKEKSPSTIIERSTDLKNWNKEKINKLKDNWNKVIVTLEKAKVPIAIIQSAKELKKDIDSKTKDIVRTATPKLSKKEAIDKIIEKRNKNTPTKSIGKSL